MNLVKQLIDEVSQDDISLAISGQFIPLTLEDTATAIIKEVVKKYRMDIGTRLHRMDILSHRSSELANDQYSDELQLLHDFVNHVAYDMWKEKFNGGIDSGEFWMRHSLNDHTAVQDFIGKWIDYISSCSKEEWLARTS